MDTPLLMPLAEMERQHMSQLLGLEALLTELLAKLLGELSSLMPSCHMTCVFVPVLQEAS